MDPKWQQRAANVTSLSLYSPSIGVMQVAALMSCGGALYHNWHGVADHVAWHRR